MILPGKHLRPERSLIGIGGDIFLALEHEQTVSELWARVQENRSATKFPLPFDWFILSLSFLYAIRAVRFERGLLSRNH